MDCIANSDTTKGPEVPLWECPCAECVDLERQASAMFDDGPTCSICDGLGHGYPGGGPCPLEDRGYWDPDD